MKSARVDDFAELVRELLAPLGEVRIRKMFGGRGVYVDDVFMAVIAYDTLWFKVGPGNDADYDAFGARHFQPFEGRDTVLSYREVPADILDDRRRIVEWARKARAEGTRKR